LVKIGEIANQNELGLNEVYKVELTFETNFIYELVTS